MEAEDNIDRGPARAAQRDSLFLMTELHSADGKSLGKARVRNLSALGLMAETDAVMREGQPVRFELRGVGEIRGQVAWTSENRLGIAFDHPIDPSLARVRIGKGKTEYRLPDYLRPAPVGMRG